MTHPLITIEGINAVRVYSNGARKELIHASLSVGAKKWAAWWMTEKQWKSFHRRWMEKGGVIVRDLTSKKELAKRKEQEQSSPG